MVLLSIRMIVCNGVIVWHHGLAKQSSIPIGASSIVGAVRRACHSKWMASRKASLHKEIFQLTVPPGLTCSRDVAVSVHQLRTGCSPFLRWYRHCIGLEPVEGCTGCRQKDCPGALCLRCGQAGEDGRHLFVECPAFRSWRETVLGGPGDQLAQLADPNKILSLLPRL